MGKEKPKIVELFPDKDAESKENMVRVLRDMIADVEAGKVEHFCMAARLNDGTVGTGWANCNVIERQLLISNLQIDVMYHITYVNLVGD